MTENETQSAGQEPAWLKELLDGHPELVFMGPFMLYLVLLAFNDKFGETYMAIPIALRGVGGLAAVWLVRHRLPPWGKPHVLLGIIFGLLAAGLWIAGQHLFNGLGLGGSWFNLADPPVGKDPRIGLSAAAWWSQAILRIAVATITVPVVEELFWRGFMLRIFINYDHFDRVPMGKFTWFSFLGTSLMSTLQHPANWGISIFCWMAFNGLFYWKRSLAFLMIVHGVTNLALYIYTIAAQDWIFW